MIPSSDQIASACRCSSSRIRAGWRKPHAAWTRPPNGLRMHEPPVPDLIPEALDDDRLIGWDDACRLLLLGEEVEEPVLGSERIEVVLRLELLRRCGHHRPGEHADRLTQLPGPADTVALPEQDAPGAGRRRDDHPVAPDLLDPPRRCAEQERLARASLVDHLLVELAHAPSVGQGHRVEPAVGNRPRIRHRELAGARPRRLDRPCDPVPDRSGAAARRTRRTGSGRRACRGRSRAACG